jgi:hypothetical protein
MSASGRLRKNRAPAFAPHQVVTVLVGADDEIGRAASARSAMMTPLNPIGPSDPGSAPKRARIASGAAKGRAVLHFAEAWPALIAFSS